MANNDSGGEGNNAWNNRKNDQIPPDLDKLVGQLQQRLREVMRRGKSSTNKSPFSAPGSTMLLSLICVGVLAIWFLSGFYVVRPAEQAAILRFGRYVGCQGPGLHWLPAVFEKAYKMNTEMVHQFPYRSEMLTQDESIIDVQISVQYRYGDPQAFLFNVADPIASLQEATASALRQVVGRNNIDDILTKGRQLVKQQVKQQLGSILQPYNMGIEITDINLQSAIPPAQVRDAFDDAIRAQEDERRYKRQAEAYRKQILPAAYGKAKSILAEAQAYERNASLRAQGHAARFMALLPEYQKASRVMRERLYLSTIEAVLKNNHLIFVDSKQTNPLLYLPLDKMFQQETAAAPQPRELKAPITVEQSSQPKENNTATNTQANSPSSYLAIADRDNYIGRFEQ